MLRLQTVGGSESRSCAHVFSDYVMIVHDPKSAILNGTETITKQLNSMWLNVPAITLFTSGQYLSFMYDEMPYGVSKDWTLQSACVNRHICWEIKIYRQTV